MYKRFVKRLLDLVLSGLAILVLAIPMLLVAIAIKIDDPGPVMFKQKRAGKKKNGQLTYFNILKFRSMKMSTPRDVPTHLLEDPDQYITRVGRIIRKTSIDELPQIYQVFTGKLSIIGPRPVLYLETELLNEREKYGANDVKPGISGWAQINGRDEIDNYEKARLDGEYVAALSAGKFKGFAMDLRCFFGTFLSVLRADGFVEGGRGQLMKQNAQKEEEKEEAVVG